MAAVLTVSDTCSRGEAIDTAGPAVVKILEEHDYAVLGTAIVPDDKLAIQMQIYTWENQFGNELQLVLTSGGTGFSPRDITPEAVSELIDRPAPGIIHLIMQKSLEITPFAVLSRPVAGVRRRSETHELMIVTFPGSAKAATENATILMPVLPHALRLLSGSSSSHAPRATGQGLASATAVAPPTHPPGSHSHHTHSHGHHHGHHHHGHHHVQPRTTNAALRPRVSPYPMISIRDAISLITYNTPPGSTVMQEVNDKLVGHTLAEDIVSKVNIPISLSTNVDGYALSAASSPPGTYKVITDMNDCLGGLPPASVYRINTGAPLPPGTDAVIMVEDTEIVEKDDDEQVIRTLASVDPFENTRKPGSDVKAGDTVLRAGDVITSVGGEMGSLAFVHTTKAKVYRKPRVHVLSTGNELLELADVGKKEDAAYAFKGIVDSNRPSLIVALERYGYEVHDHGIVPDTMERHVQALSQCIEDADVVITTGGTSMGVGDLLKPCIEKELGGTIHFGRVIMKPGKPTAFATVKGKPIFMLPGNPASALVTFYLFVLPCLRKMDGLPSSEYELPRVMVQLHERVDLDPRPEYHRVTVVAGPTGLLARSTGGQRSSRTISLAHCNGLLELPALTDNTTYIEKGELVQCILIDAIRPM